MVQTAGKPSAERGLVAFVDFKRFRAFLPMLGDFGPFWGYFGHFGLFRPLKKHGFFSSKTAYQLPTARERT